MLFINTAQTIGVFMQLNKVIEEVDEFHELGNLLLFVANAINTDSDDHEAIQAGRYILIKRIAFDIQRCTSKLETKVKNNYQNSDSISEQIETL